MNTDLRPARLSEEEWLARYQQRFIERAEVDAGFARACAEAASFADLSEFYEDDPEGAADEEMSCWG